MKERTVTNVCKFCGNRYTQSWFDEDSCTVCHDGENVPCTDDDGVYDEYDRKDLADYYWRKEDGR